MKNKLCLSSFHIYNSKEGISQISQSTLVTFRQLNFLSSESYICLSRTTNEPLYLLQNQTWVHSPVCSKANLLTPGYGEGKYSAYCRAPSKENGQLMLKRPKLPNGFQGRGFKKPVWRRGLPGAWSTHAQFSDWLALILLGIH